MEMIEAHPEKPWNWRLNSCNPNLTMKMIGAYPDKPWNWECISGNNFGWTSKETPLQYYKKRKTQTIQQTKKGKRRINCVCLASG
jgi:hypothetical protein